VLYDKLDRSVDNWALVTGSSSGIGAAFARELAARRHHLILVARREARLRQLAGEISAAHGVRVEILPADLASDEGLENVVRELDDGPPISVLISAAGFGSRSYFAEMPPEKSQQMVRLHVQAGVRLTRSVLPAMLDRRRGTIVHVSSLAGLFTTSRYVTYSATKSFLNTFCEGLAAEVAPRGVRVQALLCGLTRTEFLSSPDFADFSYQQVPELFWMSPDQVARESLEAIAKGGPVLFVPGAHNRALVGMLRAPVLGTLTRAAIELLGGRNLY
jgi:short-subunit dehydrogenase